MNPNSLTAVRVTFDDGVVYDLYPTHINEAGKISHIWPEVFVTFESMNDIPLYADWLRDCQRRGAVDPDTLGDFFA